MRRSAAAGLMAGTLVLGTGVFAVPAQAEEAAPGGTPVSRAKPLAKGSFKTKNGSAKAFKNIEGSGTYEVSLDKITVKFKVRDKKKDGWTPAIQFATLEAWDGEQTSLYFPVYKGRRNGRVTPGPNESDTITGPPIDNSVKPNNSPRPSCGSCNTIKPKPKPKPKPKTGPADGRYTFKFKKAFTSKYNEYLAVREVLVRKKGKKYQYKTGPVTIVYAAPEGPSFAFESATGSDARQAARPGDVSLGRTGGAGPGFQQAVRKLKLSGGLPSARRAVPSKVTHFTNKKEPGQLDASTETWGYFFGYKRDGGGVNSRLTLRIRDNKKDGRYSGVEFGFADDAGNILDQDTLFYTSDVAGRWGSAVVHSGVTGHLVFRSCVGVFEKVDGNTIYKPTTCGEARALY